MRCNHTDLYGICAIGAIGFFQLNRDSSRWRVYVSAASHAAATGLVMEVIFLCC